MAFFASCSSNGPKQASPVPLKTYGLTPPLSTKPTSSYVLGVGDTVIMSVWRQDSLESSATVDTEGNISLPLVGPVKVAGLTIQQTREEIANKLDKYFVDPHVDLRVTEIKSKRAYLFGEVDNPGIYYLDHQTSFWEIIAQGSYKKDAYREKVLLIRNAVPNGDKDRIQVNLVDLDPTKVQTGSYCVDLYAQNGDILYVLPTKIADVERFMGRLLNIVSPVLAIETGVVLIPEFINVLRGEGFETSSGIIVGQ